MGALSLRPRLHSSCPVGRPQALPYRQDICGVGLDSSEAGFPPRLFTAVFARAAELGWHRVAHAGEAGALLAGLPLSGRQRPCCGWRASHWPGPIPASGGCAASRASLARLPAMPCLYTGEEAGPDYVWSALRDLGVERIDHGIHCLDEPQVALLKGALAPAWLRAWRGGAPAAAVNAAADEAAHSHASRACLPVRFTAGGAAGSGPWTCPHVVSAEQPAAAGAAAGLCEGGGRLCSTSSCAAAQAPSWIHHPRCPPIACPPAACLHNAPTLCTPTGVQRLPRGQAAAAGAGHARARHCEQR